KERTLRVFSRGILLEATPVDPSFFLNDHQVIAAMRTQIASCPKCGHALLDDAHECHSCGHVISTENVPAPKRQRLSPSADDVFENCPQCGEQCRSGLVRCWQCGAFLRPEIEASYKKMRESGNYEVQRVELPIIEASHVSQDDTLKRRAM